MAGLIVGKKPEEEVAELVEGCETLALGGGVRTRVDYYNRCASIDKGGESQNIVAAEIELENVEPVACEEFIDAVDGLQSYLPPATELEGSGLHIGIVAQGGALHGMDKGEGIAFLRLYLEVALQEVIGHGLYLLTLAFRDILPETILQCPQIKLGLAEKTDGLAACPCNGLQGAGRGAHQPSLYLRDGHLADSLLTHRTDQIVHREATQPSCHPYPFRYDIHHVKCIYVYKYSEIIYIYKPTRLYFTHVTCRFAILGLQMSQK